MVHTFLCKLSSDSQGNGVYDIDEASFSAIRRCRWHCKLPGHWWPTNIHWQQCSTGVGLSFGGSKQSDGRWEEDYEQGFRYGLSTNLIKLIVNWKANGHTGIKVIFDLRSTPEIKRDGPEWADIEIDKDDVFEPYGIHRDWSPVFAEKDYGPEQIAIRYKEYTREGSEGFVKAYHDILLSAPPAYGKIFRHLAQKDAKPCLVNCTAGKDRTGVVVALLLTLVGVSPEKVGEEYALTDQGLAELRPIFVERLLKNPALTGNREGVGNMVSSKKENMVAAIKMIENDYGGAEQYMRENCELSEAEVEQLKKNLLEKES